MSETYIDPASDALPLRLGDMGECHVHTPVECCDQERDGQILSFRISSCPNGLPGGTRPLIVMVCGKCGALFIALKHRPAK